MPSKYWIKLYQEILEDPKMGRLPDNLWRRTIELFLLAGELGSDLEEEDRGHLPATGEIAWRLRQSEAELEAELDQLAGAGILTQTKTGWLVTNFVKRQEHVKPAQRMKQYRERKRDKAPVQEDKKLVTRTVTKRNTEIELDKELDKESKEGVEKATPDGKITVKDRFLELTGLSMPTSKGDISFWWANFGEILKLARGDPDLACRWEGETVSYMQSSHLTITGPKSIVGLIGALASGQTLQKKASQNGTHQNTNRKGIKALEQTGESLRDKRTFDIYTNEYVYPDGHREPASPVP